ncbi:MAG: hypothetical protein KAY24_10960 [Candidatus Eisenbacteria sp.]|nr:hypothetical protein [Candidatus Eisenbacteria bacterium]
MGFWAILWVARFSYQAFGVDTTQVSCACDANPIWDGFSFVGPDRALMVRGHVEAIQDRYGLYATLV